MLFDINLPEIKIEKETEGTANFIIEPLYPGYGLTVGNALRRVLISSLAGSAITAVKIDGIQHEFSTLPHVKEDAVTIILNLKQVRIKLFNEGPIKMTLEAKGKQIVRAGDIKISANDGEIINPDLVLATLDNDKARLSMDIYAEQGRGYFPVERREKERLPIGTIAVDAIFSPVLKVACNVENTRVGGMTDFDKLTIEIVTDGSLSPRDALTQAAKILLDHFGLLAGEKESTYKEKARPMPKPEADQEEILVEEVDFSTRTLNALLKNGIKTLGELKAVVEAGAYAKLKGFGAKAQEEVEDKLIELGLWIRPEAEGNVGVEETPKKGRKKSK